MLISHMKKMVLAACLCAAMPVLAEEESPKESQGLIGSLLGKAQELIGTPYVYGGTTPKGFDCSGFVRFVFSSFGVDLTRSSTSQATEGDEVPLDKIQAGDLLFFKTRGKLNRISHVGIYLGGGQFIHAGSWGGPGRRGVKIAQLDSSYYAQRLVSARRLLTAPNEAPQQLLEKIMPLGPSWAKWARD